jgi:hypothetical protein
LTAPPLAPAPGKPPTTFRPATVEVTAYDGPEVVGQTTLDVQVADDPVEFRDPRPDAACLEALARSSGGKVLRQAQDLAHLLQGATTKEGEVIVSRVPAWDHPALWGALLALLAVEWCLRRWWGLA